VCDHFAGKCFAAIRAVDELAGKKAACGQVFLHLFSPCKITCAGYPHVRVLEFVAGYAFSLVKLEM
jgi:hypothetical protein